MALLFADGFTHYHGNTRMEQKWDVVEDSIANSVIHSSSGARFGRGGVTFNTTGGSGTHGGEYLQKNHSGGSTIITGVAFQQIGTQNVTGSGARLFTFLDGNTQQVGIDILQSGQLQVTRATAAGGGIVIQPNNSFTILGTSTGAISSSSYDYIEAKVVHHPTTGSVTIRVNGNAFYTLTGVNTAISGSNNSASVLLGGWAWSSSPGGASASQHKGLKGVTSDFYLCDTTGSFCNDFLGDITVELLSPTADGNYEEWTLSAGSDSFALVDDAANAIDDDGTYITSSTLDQRTTFITSNSAGPAGGAVKAVVITSFCKKDDGGTNLIAGMARLSGADGVGTNADVPGTYAFRQSMIYEKPGGGSWTIANVNDAEFGVKKTN